MAWTRSRSRPCTAPRPAPDSPSPRRPGARRRLRAVHLAYTKLGFSPDGGTSLLTASLGLHRTLRLALLNPVVTAEEAHALGLVAQVCPDADLDAAAEEVRAAVVGGIASRPVATKRLLRETATPAAEVALRREPVSIRARAASPDGREGVAAFQDKRPPRFANEFNV
ncbi:enoyl-CoA hydratase-related protein [Amycolatopsis thermoflava]|uniref:enoyl-CoA hydratase-related protein n=1 Tax=Amycolatopsis thermoflava TaxID=84480 RepID=UPI0037F927FC